MAISVPDEKIHRSSRLRFIDASRGGAMLFVLLSHFGFTYFPDQNGTVPTVMRIVGMIASPTFVIISGMLLGYLYYVNADDFDRIRTKFIDRGLFLLTVGHILIFAFYPGWRTPSLFITDTIGLSMILGTVVMPRVSTSNRAVAGLVLFGISWALVLYWEPSGLAEAFKNVLVGRLTGDKGITFPFLPWFSLYLSSTALGEHLGSSAGRHGRVPTTQRLLAKSVMWAFAAGVVSKSIHVVAKYLATGSLIMPSTGRILLVTHLLTSPLQKNPPSPGYFFWYGAIGLCLISLFFLLEKTARAERVTACLITLGQNSLFVFVLEWYVYFVFVRLLHARLPYESAWPAYLITSVVAIMAAGMAWDRFQGNRIITVGYGRGLKRPLNERSFAGAGVLSIEPRIRALPVAARAMEHTPQRSDFVVGTIRARRSPPAPLPLLVQKYK